MRNVPYKPIFNDFGQIINPITRSNPYISKEPNRKVRRLGFQKERFKGNHKGVSFTHYGEHGQFKLRRIVQVTGSKKNGTIKKIYHYN